MLKTFFLLITIVLLAACASAPVENGVNQAVPETGGSAPLTETQTQECGPTQPDMLGPFYEPDAPLRDSVGKGYVLEGTVRSAGSCDPIPGAQVEVWLAGPDANYDDEYRATIIAGNDGRYRFESHFPPPYAGRPSHIHILASAPGYQPLVTQHYPEQGSQAAQFDLVLLAE
jgi:protocatechuate 3,4-dioxygenase beta subunit